MNNPFNYLKTCIRPTIDGRLGGVREFMRTMAMAQRVADLYSKELRYPDGSLAQCVIADSNIGGVDEAVACEENPARGRWSQCDSYPLLVPRLGNRDMTHRLKAVWGFNGTERPGAVYLAAVLAGHTQKGIPLRHLRQGRPGSRR